MFLCWLSTRPARRLKHPVPPWCSILTGFCLRWPQQPVSSLYRHVMALFLRQALRLLHPPGSHSIKYLCDNITTEKPSKQLYRRTKPAASTAKCSAGVIVLQLLVATTVHCHISLFSLSYVTCSTLTHVVILRWSKRATGCSLSAKWGVIMGLF